MKRFGINCLLAGALAVAGGASARAAVLLSDDFESDTIGSIPSGWSVTGPAAVSAGSSVNGTGNNAQVLNINNTSGAASTTVSSSFTSTVGSVTVTFELQFNDTSNSNGDFNWRLYDSASNVSAYLRFQPSQTQSQYAIRYYNGTTLTPTSGTTPLNQGDWYGFTITADSTAKTYSLSYVDLSNSSQTCSIPGISFYSSSAANFHAFYLTRTSTNNLINVNLDDVVVQTTPTPEPATLGLAGLAGAALLARPRGRRQR